MTVEEAIEFIRKNKRYGDRKAICDLAGISHQTFDLMLRHKHGPDQEKWWDAEYKLLCEAVTYLMEREKKKDELRKNLASL